MPIFCLITVISVGNHTVEAKTSGIISCKWPANERRRYIVMSSLIGWPHTHNDSWILISVRISHRSTDTRPAIFQGLPFNEKSMIYGYDSRNCLSSLLKIKPRVLLHQNENTVMWSCFLSYYWRHWRLSQWLLSSWFQAWKTAQIWLFYLYINIMYICTYIKYIYIYQYFVLCYLRNEFLYCPDSIITLKHPAESLVFMRHMNSIQYDSIFIIKRPQDLYTQ